MCICTILFLLIWPHEVYEGQTVLNKISYPLTADDSYSFEIPI